MNRDIIRDNLREIITMQAHDNGIFDDEIIDDMVNASTDNNTNQNQNSELNELKQKIYFLHQDLQQCYAIYIPINLSVTTMEELNNQYMELQYRLTLEKHRQEKIERERLIANGIRLVGDGLSMIMDRYPIPINHNEIHENQPFEDLYNRFNNFISQARQQTLERNRPSPETQQRYADMRNRMSLFDAAESSSNTKVNVTLTKTAIDQLKHLTYQELQEQCHTLSDDEACSICLEKLNVNVDECKYIVLQCHHIYHNKCIIEYLANYDYHCPLCRDECGEHQANL